MPLRLAVACCAAVLLAFALPAAAASDPTYAALRAARPDGRTVAVRGLVLERDVFRFTFDSGTVHFLAPVEGRTVGAVFLGDGRWRLAPASTAERRHLALVTGDEKLEALEDRFDVLVLLFGDDTAAEIEMHGAAGKGAADARATAAFERHLERQRKDFATNFHLRVLHDLLDTPGLTSGAFLAFPAGGKHPPALLAVDPRGAEALRLGPLLGGEDSLLFVADERSGGLWYLSEPAAAVKAGRATPAQPAADALDYAIETTVGRNADITGRTTVRFAVLAPRLRVLPVHLLEDLRIEKAAFAPAPPGSEAQGAEAAPGAWTDLPWVQEEKDHDADAAVVFPEPLTRGQQVLVRLDYAGREVLDDVGDGTFVVGARESWYANLGVFTDPATFTLLYRVPAGRDVVSVGTRRELREEKGQSVSVWRAERPVQVAGFNYGRFKRQARTDEETQVAIEVHTSRRTQPIRLQFSAADELADVEGAPGISSAEGEGLGQIIPERLAEGILVDGLNAARVFTTYFGPLPQKQVAITQQAQWSFGQSWPSLIFMPYLSFLDGTQRQRLGLAGASSFVEEVGYHEFAHQWWGHLVGFRTLRDQWLSEGFAEFSSALALQHAEGWGKYGEFWERTRRFLLEKTRGNAVPNWQAGPITQGHRLATQRSPFAYAAIVYGKGGFVLHMLRMLMWDGASPAPDGNFIALMKDFASTFAGKQATTADFQAVVERHMTPAMNATGDGKMDWFFRQWVHGTELPRYTQDLQLESAGKDQVRVRGTVTQEGVSPDFRALLPLYLDYGKGDVMRFGTVAMVGSASKPIDATLKVTRKPRRVVLNARHEVLARD
ncbi:MAG TPA: M1 family aminopeptidase [Thermoanaerobaculia bacterium]|nr:M1 family aminopeptidase [Thermoanaerobaculia bacterium]